ncbi:hypothetical protein [Gimesia fumaroli]|uniref:Uncharacterized protein n=1 Tax=Gimesia fumaroli TaxID=2527976 RepID=A0A518I9P0_9PLAN|nr:hypothetical protein [Gimesia fumaroli]QDV49769.1 hypothetical protein Enr17x_17900 [Gimesia fumaroli]
MMRYKIHEAYKILGQLQEQRDSSAKPESEPDFLPPTEDWEPCLREQITSHPSLVVNLSLIAGVVMGCWVKR